MSTREIITKLQEKKFEELNNVISENLLTRAIEKLDEKKEEIARKFFEKQI